jgi:SAM-dependent methyltransferase
MASNGMQRYWDRAAREDPFRYVDNSRWGWADDLDAFWRTGEEAVDALLADLGVGLAGEEDVVEIGCGVGRLTRALAAHAGSVQALDVSEEMLAHARRLHPRLTNVAWLHGDGRTLRPVADSSADACVSFVVFQHLPDPELTYGYVREMGRVLRPGGWAAFQLSNDPEVHQRPPIWKRLLRRQPRRPYRDAAWRGSAVDLGRLRQVAGDSGLEIERIQNEGTQFCNVLARRRCTGSPATPGSDPPR